MSATEMQCVGEPALVFVRPGSGRVKVSAEALAVIAKHVQRGAQDLEAGGVLIGRYLRETRDVVVDSVTEPMAGDRQSRARFFRHRKGHQDALDAAWHASGGTAAWLGEWHTHPECDPTPSRVDRGDWRRKLTTDRYDTALFFLIAGTERIRLWEGGRFSRVSPLSPLIP